MKINKLMNFLNCKILLSTEKLLEIEESKLFIFSKDSTC